MAKKKSSNQSGGVNISGKGSVTIGGDVVGRDKITTTTTTTTTGITAEQLAFLVKEFGGVNQAIDKLPENPDVDKTELKETVQKIQDEVKKGEEASPKKVERWLKFIAGMSDDIVQVTAAALLNPAAGIGTAIRLIAQKAKEEKS